MKRLIMEFLGTFFLVLAFAVTSNPIAIAAMLMAWIYIGVHVSGAHYNPAVSISQAKADYISWHQFLWYSIAQVLGGFSAFFVAYKLVGQVSIPVPANGISWTQAFITEILLAFVFTLLILVVAHTKHFRASAIAGLVIGFAIPALALVGGPISGGLFNPAISLGANLLALVKGVQVIWPNVLLYVGGSLLGGLLAAVTYQYLIPNDQK